MTATDIERPPAANGNIRLLNQYSRLGGKKQDERETRQIPVWSDLILVQWVLNQECLQHWPLSLLQCKVTGNWLKFSFRWVAGEWEREREEKGREREKKVIRWCLQCTTCKLKIYTDLQWRVCDTVDTHCELSRGGDIYGNDGLIHS